MSEKTVEEENQEQLEAIKDKAGEKHNHQKLTINRAPDEAVGKLQDISYELFAGDYGATLMYLVRLHELRSEFNRQVEDTNKRVGQMNRRISRLEEQLSDETEEKNDSKVDTIG